MREKTEVDTCFFGGDIDHGLRYCQHPKIIWELGMDKPFDVATVVTVTTCVGCNYFLPKEELDV